MPVDWSLYPPDWKEIALAVKEAAGWRCQECGKQCRRPGEPFTTHRNTLTVSHQDHDPMNCEPENLRALCAPCHLRYDRQHHAETRRRRPMNDREMTSDQIKRLLNRSATYHGKSYTISGIGTSILGVSLMLQAEDETQYVPLEQATVDGYDQEVKKA